MKTSPATDADAEAFKNNDAVDYSAVGYTRWGIDADNGGDS